MAERQKSKEKEERDKDKNLAERCKNDNFNGTKVGLRQQSDQVE
jgi:hypothetical protein